MTPKEILKLKFYCNDLRKDMTIKNYLKTLLLTLWEEQDGFSGKRPFGNGGWIYDVYGCLVKNNIISGSFDEDGYMENCDSESGEKIILEVIKNI